MPDSESARTRWVKVGAVADLSSGETMRIEIGNAYIALFNVRGALYAIDDACSHAAGSLSDGDVDPTRCAVECPLHFSCFDLRTGRALNPPAEGRIPVYPVEVRDGTIFVSLPSLTVST